MVSKTKQSLLHQGWSMLNKFVSLQLEPLGAVSVENADKSIDRLLDKALDVLLPSSLRQSEQEEDEEWEDDMSVISMDDVFTLCEGLLSFKFSNSLYRILTILHSPKQ